MATTTPNFGWPVPTSTDLVKDGATAIESLGDSIDASLLDLKGGTSGQVLSKNSNTDMDFTWVTSDDANAIQNAIVDAKGDLISATAADTPARLAVGANDTVLTADSSTSTGLKWAAPASSGGMTLLSTTTLSGATVTLSSISQAYVSLFAVIEGVTNATADGLFQINLNNGDQQQNISIMGNNNTVTNNADYLGKINSKINLARTNAENAFVLQVDNYTSTTNPKVWQFYGGYINTSSAFGTINAAGGAVRTPYAAITSIVFSNSGGNLTAGTVRLYGVK